MRLAYVRWLRARGRASAETDRELATATGVGYPWLQKWKTRPDAPDSREQGRKLCEGLGIDGAWLLDNKGAAPEPELWQHWLASQRAAAITQIPASAFKPARKIGSARRRKGR